MMLVSACYHALSLRDSKRKFAGYRQVSPHAIGLLGHGNKGGVVDKSRAFAPTYP